MLKIVSYVKRLVGTIVVPIRNKMMIDSRVEAEVANHKGAILPDPSSPERGLFNPKKSIGHAPPMSLRILPSMFKLMRPMRNNIAKTIKSLPENPSDPKTFVDESTLKELEEFAKSLGAGAIGYCKLDSKYIFQDKAVIHENVIVLSEEMDKDDLETDQALVFKRKY